MTTRNRTFVILAVCVLGVSGGIVGLVRAIPVLAHAAQVRSADLVQLRPLAEPSKVYNDEGTLIGTLQDADNRIPVTLKQVSPDGIHAVIDVEDNTFYYHGAIDARGIVRALVSDVTHGGVVQGGSTITQQLIKNSVLTPQRTVNRKLREVVLAYRLEHQMTKDQILDRYLNTVYFGHGAYGIEAASETYYGVQASQLDAGQAAMLAGLISNPSVYDPAVHPANAASRRQTALQDMVDNHDLTPAQAALAGREPLPTSVATPSPQAMSSFVYEVEQGLLRDTADYPALGRTLTERYNELFRGGLSIYTTQSPDVQYDASQSVNDVLPQATQRNFNAAVVVEDPSNGYVKAIVPGNSTSNGLGYDVATGLGGSGRPSGSSFKLFVLMAAIDSGIDPNSSIDGTQPCVFHLPGTASYAGHNAEPGGGVMSIVTATTDSVNCAYMRLGDYVGLNKVVDMAHRLGIRSPLKPVITASIGANPVTPFEMASGYATVADDGVYHRPTLVSKIVDETGRAIYQDNDPGTRVVPAAEARLATQILRTVVTSGTGTAASVPGHTVVGKTGTGNQFEDAWFVGYSPQLVTAVWVGSPAREIPMYNVGPCGGPMYGGCAPARIFEKTMQFALRGLPDVPFPPPLPIKLQPPRYIQAPFVSGAPGPSYTNNSPPPPPQPTVPSCSPNCAVPTTTAPPSTTVPATTAPPPTTAAPPTT